MLLGPWLSVFTLQQDRHNNTTVIKTHYDYKRSAKTINFEFGRSQVK